MSDDKNNQANGKVSLTDIWPQERDYMARPDRFRYLRRAITKDTSCVFCTARDKGPSLETLCLYKDESVLVILNKYPYNTGHIMILPAKHCGDIDDLTDEEYTSISLMLRKSIKIVRKVYNCQGLNVGLNHGKVAGAGIPDHLHWHVIPRWNGDTNFFPIIAETKVLPETVEQTYARYQGEF